MTAAERYPTSKLQLTLMPKFEWLTQLAGLPLDRTVILVGQVMAYFASKNGKDCRPGLSRIMWASGIKDERTVGNAVKELRRLGLIGLVHAGGGRPSPGKRAMADEYWLTTHDGIASQSVSYEQWAKQRSA